MRTLISLSLLTTILLQAQAKKEQPPFQLPANVQMKTDLVYANYGPRQVRLDLYLPKDGDGPFPAVVWVHGGGWQNGDKTRFRRQSALLAAKGLAGACIDYRLSGEARFPAAINDVKASIRWLRAHAADYKINGNKIGAVGGSAGGHLVCLLGTTGGVRDLEGSGGNAEYSSRVQAVVGLYSSADLVGAGKRDPESATGPRYLFLGKTYAQAPELWAKASPLSYVGKDNPPFLLMHGDQDKAVPFEESMVLANRLKAAGVQAELFVVPGAPHGFANRPPWFQDSLDRIERFLSRTLK